MRECQMKHEIAEKFVVKFRSAAKQASERLADHAKLTFQALCAQDIDPEENESKEEKPTVH